MDNYHNTVLIGKAGSGKSSLVNYLAGKPVRKTGVGTPVTESGFHPVLINGRHRLRVFDSSGFEYDPDRKAQWHDSLSKALGAHGIQNHASEWFHTFLYCIDASDHRVQAHDASLIESLVDKSYNVIVVFTKADCVSESDGETLAEALQSTLPFNVPVVFVCSTDSERRGHHYPAFGREELEAMIAAGFWDALCQQLSRSCEHAFDSLLESWQQRQEDYVEAHVGLLGKQRGYSHLKNEATALVTRLVGVNGTVGEFCSVIRKRTQECFDAYDIKSSVPRFPAPLSIRSVKFGSLNEYDFDQFMVDTLTISAMGVGLAMKSVGNQRELIDLTKSFVRDIQSKMWKELQQALRAIRSVDE